MAFNVEKPEEELQRESFRDRHVHQTEGVLRILTRPTRGHDAPAQGRVRPVTGCNEIQDDALTVRLHLSSFKNGFNASLLGCLHVTAKRSKVPLTTNGDVYGAYK